MGAGLCNCCNRGYTGSASKPLLSSDDGVNVKKSASKSRSEDSKWTSQLKKDAERDAKVKKLLLLGPGNSGKSTFFKQLLRIHGRGLDDLRGKYFHNRTADIKRAIYDNIIEQLRCVIIQCRSFNYKLSDSVEKSILYINNLGSAADVCITRDIASHISLIWNSEYIKLSFENRNNLSIVDSSSYFFNNINRISSTDYSPSEIDILLVRTPTTGIISSSFNINGNIFSIFDAGGQKCERSKWIHCFDNVTAVIFVASLSCFDQGLYENCNVNAMHETLNLWDEILNSRWFRPTSMILFLNKCDLFKIKLEKYQKKLNICFKNYNGNNSYKDAADYIKSIFIKINKNPKGREIYTHITCATDKNNVEKVFNDVQNIVVNSALQRGGLL